MRKALSRMSTLHNIAVCMYVSQYILYYVLCHSMLKDKLEKSVMIKGQLISKCPFGVIVWTKMPTKKFDKFLL